MSTYTKIKTLPLSLFNNAEYLSFMNHVLDLANGNSGGGDSESPDEISLLTGSDGIPELGLTKEFLDTYEADLLAMADVVDESNIGLKGSPTNVVKSMTKEAKGKGEILKDLTPDEAVKAIVDKLAAKYII